MRDAGRPIGFPRARAAGGLDSPPSAGRALARVRGSSIESRRAEASDPFSGVSVGGGDGEVDGAEA